MVELIIEQWKNLDGSNHFLWSVWKDGKRLGVSRPLKAPEAAEQQGAQWCRRSLGAAPDRVTRL